MTPAQKAALPGIVRDVRASRERQKAETLSQIFPGFVPMLDAERAERLAFIESVSPPVPSPIGAIYFLQFERRELFKVGFTSASLKERLKEHRGYYGPCEVLGTREGTKHDEWRIHSTLRPCSIKGCREVYWPRPVVEHAVSAFLHHILPSSISWPEWIALREWVDARRNAEVIQ